MNADDLDQHTEHGLEALRNEFAGIVPSEQITQLGRSQLETLRESATIYDFIPLLVYRHTRDVLLTCAADELHHSA